MYVVQWVCVYACLHVFEHMCVKVSMNMSAYGGPRLSLGYFLIVLSPRSLRQGLPVKPSASARGPLVPPSELGLQPSCYAHLEFLWVLGTQTLLACVVSTSIPEPSPLPWLRYFNLICICRLVGFLWFLLFDAVVQKTHTKCSDISSRSFHHFWIVPSTLKSFKEIMEINFKRCMRNSFLFPIDQTTLAN